MNGSKLSLKGTVQGLLVSICFQVNRKTVKFAMTQGRRSGGNLKKGEKVKDLAANGVEKRKAGQTGFMNLIPAFVQILFGLLLFRDILLLFFFKSQKISFNFPD